MSERHEFEGHEILVGEEPPPDFNGFTVSEEDFMKMQTGEALQIVNRKKKDRKKRASPFCKKRSKHRKQAKLSKRKNRRR